MAYQNYHRHSKYTNIRVIDSPVSNEDYAKRAVELGQGILATTEHGYIGDMFGCYDLAKQNGLKLLIAAEAYWVKDRFEKDRTNCHIILAAKNENGRQELNEVLSTANETGFYYQPRLDIELIMKLPPDDIWCTSSCAFGWKYEDADEIFLKFANHFKHNFFFEVQYHNTEPQKVLNRKIIDLSNKHNIPIIMGCDSHFIYPEQEYERTSFLNSKNLFYEDEAGWYLDEPTEEEAYARFKKQGVLTDPQIREAIENTNVFLEVEEYTSPIFTDDIKMPTLYPGKTKEEKDKMFVDLVWSLAEEERKNIPEEKWDHYVKEITDEIDVIVATDHADYFLLDYELVKKAVGMGGVITPTGRGCFTENSLVHTRETFKSIKDVVIGDDIITKEGKFEKVKDIFSYDIDEEMISMNHIFSAGKHFPLECTKDHLILINREGRTKWSKAKDVKKGDYVCTPKIKIADESYPTVIDLNQYNIFGYKFDEKYIYEYNAGGGKAYKYSPAEVAREIGVGKSVVENFGRKNCKWEPFKRSPGKLKALFDYIPFNTREEYCDYLESKKVRKINRFLDVDTTFNEFVGLMYGDGFTNDKNLRNYPGAIGLAINTSNDKNTVNRKIFQEISDRIGIPIYENRSKTKKLTQLFINSKLFGNFIAREFFVSRKGKEKIFNEKLFNQPKENLIGLINGLTYSDGSVSHRGICFDNSSKSLINAYKLLCLMTDQGVGSLVYRPMGVDDRGYNRAENYKFRRSRDPENCPKQKERIWQDEDFYYLPITKVGVIPAKKTMVYDLSVENEPSFLINNMIVHNSGSSMYLNKLLGFTTVDRIAAPVPLIPERFMSKSRILEAKSIADLDLNTSKPEIFAQAQSELLGELHAYPMIAFGTLKEKSAWKMFARAKNVDPQIANDVSKQIDKYETAKKYAETDEDRDEIDINKYIDSKYIDVFEESKQYWGIIDNIKQHPCGYLLYMGDIRREIGLVMIKSKTTKKETLCALMDGKYVEKFKFLKNDLLKVSVIDMIDRVFKRIEQPMLTSAELIKTCESDKKVWNVYEMAATHGVNQCEQPSTAGRVAQYKPQNISELTAFVAAIRPGAKTIFKDFSNRTPFSYNIKTLDDLIQTKEFPYSFILYQETQMNILSYAGIPMDQTYEIIKSISKKRINKILKYKEAFIEGFEKKVMEGENTTPEQAMEVSHKVWQIIEDSASYIFNASHAYCVAIDSLYGAYLKSHYPLQFYEVFLNLLEEKNEKKRMTATKIEAEKAYNIFFPPMRFRQDNRKISLDAKKNQITNSIKSIKNFNKSLADFLYSMKDLEFDTFTDLLVYIEENGTLGERIKDLIIIQYFEEFGSNGKLLEIFEEVKKGKFRYGKKLKPETKEKRLMELKKIEASIADYDMGIKDQMDKERELLGYIQCTYPNVDKRNCFIIDVDTKYAPRLTLFSLGSGKTQSIKIQKAIFKHKPLVPGDIIFCEKFQHKKAVKKIDGEFVEQEEKQWWCSRYEKVNHLFL